MAESFHRSSLLSSTRCISIGKFKIACFSPQQRGNRRLTRQKHTQTSDAAPQFRVTTQGWLTAQSNGRSDGWLRSSGPLGMGDFIICFPIPIFVGEMPSRDARLGIQLKAPSFTIILGFLLSRFSHSRWWYAQFRSKSLNNQSHLRSPFRNANPQRILEISVEHKFA